MLSKENSKKLQRQNFQMPFQFHSAWTIPIVAVTVKAYPTDIFYLKYVAQFSGTQQSEGDYKP